MPKQVEGNVAPGPTSDCTLWSSKQLGKTTSCHRQIGKPPLVMCKPSTNGPFSKPMVTRGEIVLHLSPNDMKCVQDTSAQCFSGTGISAALTGKGQASRLIIGTTMMSIHTEEAWYKSQDFKCGLVQNQPLNPSTPWIHVIFPQFPLTFPIFSHANPTISREHGELGAPLPLLRYLRTKLVQRHLTPATRWYMTLASPKNGPEMVKTVEKLSK